MATKGAVDPMRERVAAAARLARTVAGDDDARFLQVFQAVLNAADAAERTAENRRTGPTRGTRRRAAPRPGTATTDGIPTDSVYSDPVFVANGKWLVASRRRIVGGAPTSDFRDCVAVGTSDQWCCTGTLIAPGVVLTAGHCEKGGCGSRIFVGDDVDRPGDGRIVAVRERRSHQGYRPPRAQDDLAVLVLAETVDGVEPRAIAPLDALAAARTVRVVGFGHTDNDGSTGYGLRRLVDVPLATNDRRFGSDPTTEFVAGAPFLDRDSCSGDSGGPAYVFHGGRWLLAGATSRATNSSVRTCGDGGVYTLVAAYRDWLAPSLGTGDVQVATARRRGAPRP